MAETVPGPWRALSAAKRLAPHPPLTVAEAYRPCVRNFPFVVTNRLTSSVGLSVFPKSTTTTEPRRTAKSVNLQASMVSQIVPRTVAAL